jgi:hypothetical protein
MVELQQTVKDELNSVTLMINSIEWMKRQLIDLQRVMDQEKNTREISNEATALLGEMQRVEDELLQPTVAEGDSKSFRYAHKLYYKYAFLATDLASSIDFAPNKQQQELHKVLQERLAIARKEYTALVSGNVKGFNDYLKNKGITAGIVERMD